MPFPTQELHRCAHALLDPETAAAAAIALNGSEDRCAIDGLVELISHAETARDMIAAIEALEGCKQAMATEAIEGALRSDYPSVRIVAIQSLHRRGDQGHGDALLKILQRDGTWMARRAAVYLLGDFPEPWRWKILCAIDDPHWRVRHALLQVLLRWSDQGLRSEIEERLVGRIESKAAQGMHLYLQYKWSGEEVAQEAMPEPFDPEAVCPFWDWDPAVVARTLGEMSREERRAQIAVMPFLLGNADERIRRRAVEILRAEGGADELAQVLRLLDDTRNGAAESVHAVLTSLNMDRAEELANHVLCSEDPSPAALSWSLDQLETTFPLEEVEDQVLPLFFHSDKQPLVVRCALARLAGRTDNEQGEGWLKGFSADPEDPVKCAALEGILQKRIRPEDFLLNGWLQSSTEEARALAGQIAIATGKMEAIGALVTDPSSRARAALAKILAEDNPDHAMLRELQFDPHPTVRAAAMTHDHAEKVLDRPELESSWRVVATAARIARKPFWEYEPEERWKPLVAETERAYWTVSIPEPASPRAFGPGQWQVTPLGISGHYGLPVEGFARAIDVGGVNLLFWEPNYSTLTSFASQLSASVRDSLYFVAGTFEAEPKAIRRDVDRALRLMRLERLDLFLLFWTRSWARITEPVREALEALKEEGKIRLYSLSSHNRALAVEAIESGWNPIMVRHSIAHRKAEEEIFPKAIEHGTDLITFNNTCYGRLLAPVVGAAACYRYTLAQPGVTVCLSAPATLEQLEENLTVLQNLEMSEGERSHLQEWGARAYQEETIFRRLIRAL